MSLPPPTARLLLISSVSSDRDKEVVRHESGPFLSLHLDFPGGQKGRNPPAEPLAAQGQVWAPPRRLGRSGNTGTRALVPEPPGRRAGQWSGRRPHGTAPSPREYCKREDTELPLSSKKGAGPGLGAGPLADRPPRLPQGLQVL